MKKTLIDTYRSLTYNLRTLFFFEVIYRVIGLLVIFPLGQLLFHLSIRLSGYAYITNSLLFTYLVKPSTIIIFIIMGLFLAVYIVVELVFLSLIFDFGYHEKNISFRNLLIYGSKKLLETLKKYRLRIIGPAFLFIILVELFHIVGIASTFNVPEELLFEINKSIYLQLGFYSLIVFLGFLFIETIFTINLYTIEKIPTKKAFEESQTMLKKKRLEMVIEFIGLNIILNGILYLIYALIIILIGFAVSIIKGEIYTLSVILTLLYSVYLIIGFLATITLIPINYAMISSWYYEAREKMGLLPTSIPKKKISPKLINMKYVRRTTIATILIIFLINISSVITLLRTPKVQIELFNYAEIIAHRGSSFDAPENTLAAVELAIEQGADAVEIDVRETSDLIPILFHDRTTGRTTNDSLNRRVANMTLAEMKSLDAGSWFSPDFIDEKVPTLEETIIRVDKRAVLFIEMKVYSQTIEESVLSLVEQYDLLNHVVILSFSRDQIRRMKQSNPDIQTLLLVSTFYGDINLLAAAEDIDYFGFSEFFFMRNDAFVKLIHENNKKVYVWTVNDDVKIEEVISRDADGVITDRPVRAREIAYSRNTTDILIDILRRFFKVDN
jgi:glycerophosphoryl diester phosphodiesterase